MLKIEGRPTISDNIRYKQTVDGMAKHIVYGNIKIQNYRVNE